MRNDTMNPAHLVRLGLELNDGDAVGAAASLYAALVSVVAFCPREIERELAEKWSSGELADDMAKAKKAAAVAQAERGMHGHA